MKSAKSALFKRDENETKQLSQAAKSGALAANRSSKALGLVVTYIEAGWMIEEYSDGTTKKIKKHETTAVNGLKKGTVLRMNK